MPEEFLLTPALETPLDLRTVAVTSALGRALVGHHLGETVEVTTAMGRREVRIVGVRRSA
jgi:transcription elongation GreA/GreB family factor